MLKVTVLFLLVGICFAGEIKSEVLTEINQQIMYELRASYFYQAYSVYFDRSDVALPGFAKWFEKASVEEREHATMLMEYVNKRGGKVSLKNIQYSNLCEEVGTHTSFPDDRGPCICQFMSHVGVPEKSKCKNRNTWKNAQYAMEDALVLETKVNELLIKLHTEADRHRDAHLAHILEHHFLDEQVEAIKKLNDYITQLKLAGDGLGEYMFDKQLQ